MAKALGICVVDCGQTAAGMIRNFGDAAEHEALARADKFEKLRDDQGCDTWTTVARMIYQGTYPGAIENNPVRSIADPPAWL